MSRSSRPATSVNSERDRYWPALATTSCPLCCQPPHGIGTSSRLRLPAPQWCCLGILVLLKVGITNVCVENPLIPSRLNRDSVCSLGDCLCASRRAGAGSGTAPLVEGKSAHAHVVERWR